MSFKLHVPEIFLMPHYKLIMIEDFICDINKNKLSIFEYDRLMISELINEEKSGTRLEGYCDFILSRGIIDGDYVLIHICHRIESNKYWLPQCYNVNHNEFNKITNMPLSIDNISDNSDKIFSFLGRDLNNDILLRFIDNKKRLLYEKFYKSDFRTNINVDIYNTININNELFMLITGQEINIFNIIRNKTEILDNIINYDYDKIRIADNKKEYWFDKRMDRHEVIA